jgi:hypothetical protein
MKDSLKNSRFGTGLTPKTKAQFNLILLNHKAFLKIKNAGAEGKTAMTQ